MGYAFISYSAQQQQNGDALRLRLQQNGIQTWMAPYDIPEDSEYSAVIHQVIRDAACVVLLLTPETQESVFIDKEIERALHYGKIIAPIQLDNVVLNDSFSFYLCNNQIVMVNAIDEESDTMQRLIQDLQILCAADEAGVGDGAQRAPKDPKKTGNLMMLIGAAVLAFALLMVRWYDIMLVNLTHPEFVDPDILPSLTSVALVYAALHGIALLSLAVVLYGFAWRRWGGAGNRGPLRLLSRSQKLFLGAVGCCFVPQVVSLVNFAAKGYDYYYDIANPVPDGLIWNASYFWGGAVFFLFAAMLTWLIDGGAECLKTGYQKVRHALRRGNRR